MERIQREAERIALTEWGNFKDPVPLNPNRRFVTLSGDYGMDVFVYHLQQFEWDFDCFVARMLLSHSTSDGFQSTLTNWLNYQNFEEPTMSSRDLIGLFKGFHKANETIFIPKNQSIIRTGKWGDANLTHYAVQFDNNFVLYDLWGS
jgi:hypothetical protein